MNTVDRRTIDGRLDRFRSAARDAGLKLTHQRLEVFREVASSLEHPDAESVFRAVRKRVPTVSIDTVYRALWMLTDLGLITTLGPRRESVRFDANLDQHHHYVCVRCGLTRDFECAELGALRVPGLHPGPGPRHHHPGRGAGRLQPLRRDRRQDRETEEGP